MKKILMLPLDERPCNYYYPQMMPKADYQLIVPPKSIMGDKKTPGNADQIIDWLINNAPNVDAMVISLDTLIYGGIVPSRLHHLPYETLINRALTIKTLRNLNKSAKIYLFQLIMRCPSYSNSDEEPNYYDECGAELFLYGRYTHLQKLGKLTPQDEADFENIKAKIKPEYLQDFISRRQTNLKVLMHNLNFILDGVCDYFIVPQDDASEYGFTSMDQLTVREFIKENSLHLKTAMYPSADDTGLILLGRAVCQLSNIKPKVYVHYASCLAPFVIPWFEDRVLDETIKFHILALGGIRVYSLEESDICLLINMGSGMYHKWQGEYVKAYDIERNLAEFIDYTKYALDKNKVVAIGDVATCNGGDWELFNLLYNKDLFLKIHAYAGWNTSSNTIGTTLCQASLYLVGKDRAGTDNFLIHRYYEDLGYMNQVRKDVTENFLPTLNISGTQVMGYEQIVANKVNQLLTSYIKTNYPKLAQHVKSSTVTMPWKRMFEAHIILETE